MLLLLVLVLALPSCATVVGPNGQPQQVMTPMGAGIVQTLVSVGVGAGTGALMRNSPGWANGAVSGGASSIVSQVANSFIPQSGRGYSNYQQRVPSNVYAPAGNYYQQPAPQRQTYNPQGGYAAPLYYQRPDGSFARAN